MAVSAKVICDSKFGDTRLTTLEIEVHRFILPEINTHRTLSRNFQSSRAVPIKQMIEQVRNDPAMPLHWGKNQPGMVAEAELSGEDLEFIKEQWVIAAGLAAIQADAMNALGVHKQVVNRILEPFMWTKGVVTGTQEAWEAFLKLRAHKDAQPEIQALAFKIKDALENSEPTQLQVYDWHLPYVDQNTFPSECYESWKDRLMDMIKVSTSCCAQVSYRRLDDSVEKAIKIYDMLNLPCRGVYPENPPHFSPTEHVAYYRPCGTIQHSGNFSSKDLMQYRKMLEIGMDSNFSKED